MQLENSSNSSMFSRKRWPKREWDKCDRRSSISCIRRPRRTEMSNQSHRRSVTSVTAKHEYWVSNKTWVRLTEKRRHSVPNVILQLACPHQYISDTRGTLWIWFCEYFRITNDNNSNHMCIFVMHWRNRWADKNTVLGDTLRTLEINPFTEMQVKIEKIDKI